MEVTEIVGTCRENCSGQSVVKWKRERRTLNLGVRQLRTPCATSAKPRARPGSKLQKEASKNPVSSPSICEITHDCKSLFVAV